MSPRVWGIAASQNQLFVLIFVCRISRANVLRQNAEKQKNTIDNDA